MNTKLVNSLLEKLELEKAAFKLSDSKGPRGVLVSPKEVKVVEVPNGDLDKLYKLLDCNIFTLTYRNIKDSEFCIYCDDEGLLKPNNSIMAWDGNDINSSLVGNLIFSSVKVDNDGYNKDLTDDEILEVLNNTKIVSSILNPEPHYCVVGVGY